MIDIPLASDLSQLVLKKQRRERELLTAQAHESYERPQATVRDDGYERLVGRRLIGLGADGQTFVQVRHE